MMTIPMLALALLAQATSQPTTLPTSQPTTAATPCPCQGKPGIWFPTAAALKLSNEVQNCRKELPTLRELTERLRYLAYTIHPRHASSITRELELVNKKVEVFSAENTRLAGALIKAQRRPWYKDPLLWFAVGLVVGGGTVTAVVVAAR